MSEAANTPRSRTQEETTPDDIRDAADIVREEGFDRLADYLDDGADNIEEAMPDG